LKTISKVSYSLFTIQVVFVLFRDHQSYADNYDNNDLDVRSDIKSIA